MPKLKPATQRARREHILDAAEVCFAHSGFHRTTMQDICKEALISPGALYVYFASKEDLIAGIAERDRAEFAERFAELSAAPEFMKALSNLGEHYFGGGARLQAHHGHRDRARVDAQPQGRRHLPLGRPLRARELREAVPAPRARGAHRARPRHPDGRESLLDDRRRHVHAPRHRPRFRRQGGHAGRDGPHRQAAQPAARVAPKTKSSTEPRR